MTKGLKLVFGFSLFLLAACATSGGKFGKIYPGMTSDQVAQTMNKGPTKVNQFSEGYAAWYFGEDQCLLMQQDKVVAKNVTEEKAEIEAWGLGGVTRSQKAECIPPGYKSTAKVERTIETPFGTVKH